MTGRLDHEHRDGTRKPSLPLTPGDRWPRDQPFTLLTDAGGALSVVVEEGRVLVETTGLVPLNLPEVREVAGLMAAAHSRAGGEPE